MSLEDFHMDIFAKIQESLTEILDIEVQEITPETYIVRDLSAESIDLLELSVALNSRFNIEVNDDEVFLRTLRFCLNEAEDYHKDRTNYLTEKFPFLGTHRVREILSDLDGGPVLKVKDLMAYVSWQFARK
jgi:acyl carrier protein